MTQATPVKQGSVAFAIVATLFYIFLYPVGLILNFIGLITGPRRGCFVSLLLFFVALPVILIVVVLKTGAQFAIPYFTDIVRFVEGWLRHVGI